jgi:hypothetical protein
MLLKDQTRELVFRWHIDVRPCLGGRHSVTASSGCADRGVARARVHGEFTSQSIAPSKTSSWSTDLVRLDASSSLTICEADVFARRMISACVKGLAVVCF